MKLKYNICLALTLSLTVCMQAQTMRWLPVTGSAVHGKCTIEEDKFQRTQCYVLEYVPAVTGVLTSYTAGFFVSCASTGSVISKNLSCAMSSSIRLVDGCSNIGKVLMSNSGNSGSAVNNKVEAGIPTILHQICLTIPVGESVDVEEDPVTDLTTSIDLIEGGFTTEFPEYETATFKCERYSEVELSALLDFQVFPVGQLTSKLDWSTTPGRTTSTYIVERSLDGLTFVPIGEQNADKDASQLNIYQFLDNQAIIGANYYRLRLIDANGDVKYSPTRKIVFEKYPFTVTATPNPAKDKVYIRVSNAKASGTITLVDLTGVERLVKDFDQGQADVEVQVNLMEPGTYTLMVTSDTDTHVEKIVIIK